MDDSADSLRTVFSTDVTIELMTSGKRYELGQVGPEYAFVRDPDDLPPCDGEVIVYVDGKPCRRDVRLVDGMSRHSNDVRLVDR